jgi:hypothetical protein
MADKDLIESVQVSGATSQPVDLIFPVKDIGSEKYARPVYLAAASAGSSAVTIASGADVAEGATNATAYSDATGAAVGTLVGLLKGLYVAIKGTVTVALQGDAVAASLYSIDQTLGSADVVTSHDIPTGARGFRILSASARLRFAVNADPPASYATNADSATAVVDLGLYNNVLSGVTEVRVFQPGGTNTTLRVNSETASATYTVEFF